MEPRALTFEEYLAAGLDEETARALVDKQKTLKVRKFRWQTAKISEELAAKVNDAFPEVDLHRL